MIYLLQQNLKVGVYDLPGLFCWPFLGLSHFLSVLLLLLLLLFCCCCVPKLGRAPVGLEGTGKAYERGMVQ